VGVGVRARQVEELTADLIAAKLGQAELANAGMALTHEKRQLEKQARGPPPPPPAPPTARSVPVAALKQSRR
jgi:hypothetical protein